MKAKDFRKEARESLRGKWQIALIISLIYTAIIFAINLLSTYVNGIFGIAILVITPPLAYGTAYAYFHLKNGENVGYADFLKVGFSNFGKSWKITWEIIKKCWWCILLIIIPIIILIVGLGSIIYNNVSGISSYPYNSSYSYYDYNYDDYDYLDDYYDSSSSYSDYTDSYEEYLDNYYDRNNDSYSSRQNVLKLISGMAAGTIIVSVLVMLGYITIAVLVTIKMMLYVLSYYIAVSNENLTPKEAVLESERLMRGNRGRYFCLVLSFIGWSFLAGLASGIVSISGITILSSIVAEVGVILLTPYMTFSIIAFYQELSRNNNNIGGNQTVSYATSGNNVNIEYNNTYNVPANNEDSTKKCPNCGAINKLDSAYCINCGSKFE